MLMSASKRTNGLGVAALIFPVLSLSGIQGQITVEEIALHAANDDCWSSVYGEVFDVTDYAPSHPNPSVYSMCGMEATTLFDAFHGDTPNYMDIFPSITYLGTLAEPTKPPTSSPPTASPTDKPTDPPTPAPTEPATTPVPTKAPTPGTPAPAELTPAPTKAPAIQTPAPTDAAPSTLSPAPTDPTTTATPAPTAATPSAPGATSAPTPTMPPTHSNTPAPALVQIPLVEVTSHNTDEDCWVALHENVYEFHSFLRLHPGGRDLISPCCGFDCTAPFDDQHDLTFLEHYAKYYLVGPLEKVMSTEEMSTYNTTDNCLVSYFGRIFNATACFNGITSVADYTATVSKTLTAIEIDELPCGDKIALSDFAAMSPEISDFYVGASQEGLLYDGNTQHGAGDQFSLQPIDPGASVTVSVTLPPAMMPGGDNSNDEDDGDGDGDDSGMITPAELAQHASEGDCWSIYFGAVYEMTNYVHPGGQTLITASCGGDASSGFSGAGHPNSYMSMVSQYKLGTFNANSNVGGNGGGNNPEPAPVPVPAPAPPPEPETGNNNSGGNTQITANDLAQHASEGDCWSVYFGEVYDMTSYSHPGGQGLITASCGGDATSGFEGAGHPSSYMNMVSQYKVGTFNENSNAGGNGGGNNPEPAPAPEPDTGNNNSGGNGNGPITPAELLQHSSDNDCWSVYFGDVYDMTSYSHPGGQSLITGSCGGDATSGFQGAGHPDSYMNMVSQFKIGPYAGGDAPAAGNNNGGPITTSALASHSSSGDCWVAYYGEVYDVTGYAPSHPAGEGLVTMDCGGDGTSNFEGAHSRGMLGMISGSFMGMLEGFDPSPDGGPASDGYPMDSESMSEDEEEDEEEEKRPAPAPAPDNNAGGNGNGPITPAELSQHVSSNDCWSVYFGEVYDMTSYSHPGGQGLITSSCGGDATSSFQGAGHPDSYMNMVSQFKIGPYAGGPAPAPAPAPQPVPANTGGGMITLAELGQHSNSGDCWVAYFGEVYDVTSYAPRHPAGSGLVTGDCGRDGTFGFSSAHGRGTLGAIRGSFVGNLEGGYNGPVGGGGGYDSPESMSYDEPSYDEPEENGGDQGGDSEDGGGGDQGGGSGGEEEEEESEESEDDRR